MVEVKIEGCLSEKEEDIDAFLKIVRMNIIGVRVEDGFPIRINYTIKGDNSGKEFIKQLEAKK